MKTMAHWAFFALLILPGCDSERHLRLATTTSVDNSGLLVLLLDTYEQESDIAVDALAVGSGRAMELVRRGDADLMLTHDPVGEHDFLASENPLLYRKLMCSDFLVLGPPDDPAEVASSSSVREAMTRIAASDSPFISRGDRSGTHMTERMLWHLAGTGPRGELLLETGQGMAATLRIASERHGYVLTDRPTFLQIREGLALEIVYEGADTSLLNCYAITVPPGPREENALELADWLSRGKGRALIESFAIDGERAFRVWPHAVPDDHPDARPQ